MKWGGCGCKGEGYDGEGLSPKSEDIFQRRYSVFPIEKCAVTFLLIKNWSSGWRGWHSWDTGGPALSRSAGKKRPMVSLVSLRHQAESSVPLPGQASTQIENTLDALSVRCRELPGTGCKVGDKAQESFTIVRREKEIEIVIYPGGVG